MNLCTKRLSPTPVAVFEVYLARIVRLFGRTTASIVLSLTVVTLSSQTSIAQDGVIQVNGALASGHFVRGLDLTDDQPAIFVGLDWTGNNGVFSGAECYRSNSDRERSLNSGCQFYLGYFKALANGQALAVKINHSEYATSKASEWDFTQIQADWHINQQITFSLSATDDWLGRGFSTVAVDAAIRKPLNDRISAHLKVGVMKIESRAPIDFIELAEFGVQYQQQRWLFEVAASFSDREDLRRMTRLEVDSPEINAAVRYRFY